MELALDSTFGPKELEDFKRPPGAWKPWPCEAFPVAQR